MLQYERTNAVVSLTLIGLALYFVLEFPARVASISLFGSPLGVNTPRRWLMIMLLVSMTMAGADMVMRSHPILPNGRMRYLATFWMLPGLVVVTATQILGFVPDPLIWGVSLLTTGLFLWLTIVAEFQQVPGNDSAARWAALWRPAVGYALALVLFALIYHSRSRSILSASQVLLVSGMVALSLLRLPPAHISRTWLYASLIGLCVGQMTWALNYWRISTLRGSLLLFLAFYVLVGLAQQHLTAKLARRTLWEYGAIAVVALVVIYNL